MKNYVCKLLLLAGAICLAIVQLHAQTSPAGKITARVIDAQTQETIPYATAILLDRKTKSTVKSSQTSANGELQLSNLPNGVFLLRLVYVGYQTVLRDSIVLSASRNSISLGTVRMSAAKGTQLKEVNVTAQRSTMQLGIDKKVFSVDQSLVSQGGSATDVLQNVPSIQTDMDGNVSLRGSAGVRVLIDGKPSMIAGGNVAQILQSIPASSIESVEVITNPSAKYDAEGQSGIINIVLKKNKKLGLNGSVALSAGNLDNYNASSNLSFQNKTINIYGNYSYRHGNRLGGGYNNIIYRNMPFPTVYADQLSDSRSNDKSHNVKTGLDYYVAPKSVLSVSGGFNFRDQSRDELLSVNEFDAGRNPLKLSSRNNGSKEDGNSYDLNLDFSQKFKNPKEELIFNASYSKGEEDELNTFKTNLHDLTGGAAGTVPEIRQDDELEAGRSYNIQADYTRPVGENGKFETGYRSQMRYADESRLSQFFDPETGTYSFNPALTNDFNSKDQIHALYINYQNEFKNFGYQLGLRAEDARLDTRFGGYNNAGGQDFATGKVDYTRLYPSIYLTRKFKAEQSLQISYSRRVNRPRGREVNPFRDVSEPFSQRQGNPNLRPEDVHAFELSYSKYWPSITFISTAYLRQTNDVIQWVRTPPDELGVTLGMPQNLTRDVSTGLELIGRFDISKKWNFTANTNFYQSTIDGVPEAGVLETSGFSWNANLTSNVTLPYNLSLQARGEYRSPQVKAQGSRDEMYLLDAGAKYDFKNKKSSLSLNVRNLLNSMNFGMTTDIPNSLTSFKRYMTGPMASLTYAYRFGKTDFTFKKSKKQDQGESRSAEESF
jgi:outer membrane receptor protein involved in Fe transport